MLQYLSSFSSLLNEYPPYPIAEYLLNIFLTMRCISSFFSCYRVSPIFFSLSWFNVSSHCTFITVYLLSLRILKCLSASPHCPRCTVLFIIHFTIYRPNRRGILRWTKSLKKGLKKGKKYSKKENVTHKSA